MVEEVSEELLGSVDLILAELAYIEGEQRRQVSDGHDGPAQLLTPACPPETQQAQGGVGPECDRLFARSVR